MTNYSAVAWWVKKSLRGQLQTLVLRLDWFWFLNWIPMDKNKNLHSFFIKLASGLTEIDEPVQLHISSAEYIFFMA